MQNIKIGKSIKTFLNGKENFYTVESYQGDIGLFQNGKLKFKRKRTENTFNFNSKKYQIIY